MTLKNNRAPFLCCYKLCAPFHSQQWFQTGVTVRKPPYWVKIEDLFVPRDLEIRLMTLKDNRAPLISNFKLCALFHSHQWIQTVTVQKRPIWWKSMIFLSRLTFKFDRWPWKIIGQFFYAISSFVHHFVAIGEFEFEDNGQFLYTIHPKHLLAVSCPSS